MAVEDESEKRRKEVLTFPVIHGPISQESNYKGTIIGTVAQEMRRCVHRKAVKDWSLRDSHYATFRTHLPLLFSLRNPPAASQKE
jgi:hypothetical protein